MPTHPSDSVSTPLRAQPARERTAFTLLELLVALFIAVALLGVVFYLFGQLQRGTRISLLRAQIALTASTVDARLRDDAAGMLGPNREPQNGQSPAGCLVIVPALRQGFVPLPNGSMSRNKVRLRSDQLVFMAQRNPNAPHPWISLVPKVGNLPPDITSYEARLWYGALRDGNLDQGSDEALMAHRWMVGRDLKLVRKTVTGIEPLNLALDPLLDYTPDLSAPSGSAGGMANVLAAANTWNLATRRYDQAGWTDADYLANLIGKDASNIAIPDSQIDYTNPPLTTPVVDLKQLQHSADAKNEPHGVQITDMQQAHMRLLDNCSEIVVQFAADLDKDGMLDTYPGPSVPYNPAAATTATNYPGHPLAGGLIWYPEELHHTSLKDTQTRPGLDGNLRAKFDAIKNNDWNKAFPAGFAPCVKTWPAGRFGDLPGGGWMDRFLFEYGETNNAPSQAVAAPKVPAAYVFRFEDDQYRLVNYGFRQDGSIYANKFDAMGKNAPAANGIAPFPVPATSQQQHWTPFPPTLAAATTNPTTTQLYTQAGTATAPEGPYPRNAATPAAAAGLNFGDELGDRCMPWQSQPPYSFPIPPNPFPLPAGPYPCVCRTPPNTKYDVTTKGLVIDINYPNGQAWSAAADGTVTAVVPPPAPDPLPAPPDRATGTEPVYDPTRTFRTPNSTYYDGTPLNINPPAAWANGQVLTVALNGTITQGAVSAGAAEPVYNLRAHFRTPNGTFYSAGTLQSDAVNYPKGQLLIVTQAGQVTPETASLWGTEPVYDPTNAPTADNPYVLAPGSFGLNNNHNAVYSDLWRQWFKAVNDPVKQGTAVDWRNPQSDWPKLIRLRFRLHDPQGLIFSYSDEALLNGRDDDGDGAVDNPEEGRMAGVWYEYILAVPYPLDPAPHDHGN